ncbi:pyroglutamyl-peptidase I [Oceanobacillus sp. CAU 1775]
MKKLLLTGFEPFLRHPINPTEKIVETLNQEEINEYLIIGEVLPVIFNQSGDSFIDLLDKHKPDAVISLGLAAGRNKITPERIAINCNDGPEDNEGYKPNGEKIVENGPDGYFSKLPIREIVENLKKSDLPATISNTAGAYLYNNIMYRGLHYLAKNQIDIPAGFIHIPASHATALESNIPSWSDADLIKAIRISIKSL